MIPLFQSVEPESNTTLRAYVNNDNNLFMLIGDNPDYPCNDYIVLDMQELELLIKHLQECLNDIKTIKNNG